MYDQLYRIRLYKLAKLLYLNIRNKIEYKEPPEPYEEAIDLSEELIATARATRNSETYCKIGRAYMEKGDYDQALDWFQEGISINPAFDANYFFLGRLYYRQKMYREALYWFKKLLELFLPPDPYCIYAIAQVYADSGLYSEAVDFFSKERARNPLAEDFLLMFKLKKRMLIEAKVKKWIKADIGKMISICAERNIEVIVQNYPDILFEDMLGKVANKHGIPFVDHGHFFAQILAEEPSREQYFVPDGHPNARGYGLMAKNIWMTLKEKGPH